MSRAASPLSLSPHPAASLLIDTGWGYNAYRDANRIAAIAKRAKIKKIDYVLITHYHADHVGGVPQLVTKIPVSTFIDHGPNREDSNATSHLYSEYQAAIAGSNHILATPGEKLPIKGLDVEVVSADGNLIGQPLPGRGPAQCLLLRSCAKGDGHDRKRPFRRHGDHLWGAYGLWT